MASLKGGRERPSHADAEFGYGLRLAHGVVTPYAGFGLASEETRTLRAGARWRLGESAELGLEGTPSETKKAVATIVPTADAPWIHSLMSCLPIAPCRRGNFRFEAPRWERPVLHDGPSGGTSGLRR